MEASRRSPGYDLFKFIVALLLLILFFFLLKRPGKQAFSPMPTVLLPTATIASKPPATFHANTTPSPAPGINQGFETATPSLEAEPSVINIATQGATAFASATSLAPTTNPSPTPTGTETAEPTPTLLPSLTSTPTVEPKATPTETTQITSACEAATSRSRLKPGMRATILRRLNFRSSPGIRDNWVLTNVPGTQVEIVSGPECLPYWTGAYLWWQVKLPDGRTGWSAEGSLHGTFYFMEPME